MRRGRRGRLGVIIYLACQCACRASGRVRRIRVPGPSGGVWGRGGARREGGKEGGPLHLPHQRHIPAAAPIAPRRRGCVSITIPIASLSGSDRNVQITSRTRKKIQSLPRLRCHHHQEALFFSPSISFGIASLGRCFPIGASRDDVHASSVNSFPSSARGFFNG